MNADKVYFYYGFWSSKRVEGEVKGFIPALFSDGKAVILVTHSQTDAFCVGRYAIVDIDLLAKLP